MQEKPGLVSIAFEDVVGDAVEDPVDVTLLVGDPGTDYPKPAVSSLARVGGAADRDWWQPAQPADCS